MNTHVDKAQENRSHLITTQTSQNQHDDESIFQFADNRPETVEQSKRQEIVNKSTQIKQLMAFQEIADQFSTQQQPFQRKENITDLPDNLKTGIENLSGMALDDVKVHRNSEKPAQLQAHAFTEGAEIHLGPGQEKHLPHEAWHVVQQKQGRVKPTLQLKGKVNVNDDAGLEKEADEMGAKALSPAQHSLVPRSPHPSNTIPASVNHPTVQRVVIPTRHENRPMNKASIMQALKVREYDDEAIMIIDALIRETKRYTLSELQQMLPGPAYTSPGRQESALDKQYDFGHHPLGFQSGEDFQLFILKTYQKMPTDDVTIVFHGSSLTGQSFKDKGGSRLFDVGRESDFDIALASPKLWQMAIEANVKIRGNHSEPLTPEQLQELGLAAAQQEAQFHARREVNFMLYQTVETAHQHEGPALVAGKEKNYREISGSFH